jgi:deoxycytidylate deaminase
MIKISEKKLDALDKKANATSDQSHDIHTQVGALLVHSKTGADMMSGYNGYIRGAADDVLPKTRPEKYQYMIHAEANLIYNCARHGVSTDECFVYCTLSPCSNCIRTLYQSGITKVYFRDVYKDFLANHEQVDFRMIVSEIGKYYELEIVPR